MADRIDYTIPPWDRTDSVSRALVRLITQSTNDGIWDWNLETDEVYYSPRWLELVGYLPNELPGHIDTFVKLLHPDDRERGERTIAEYLSGTRPEYRNEFRLQHKDGSWRWIFTHGIVLRDSAGRAIRLAGTHTDISDRVHAAELLESIVEERTIDLRAARDDLARLFKNEEARALELAKSLEELQIAQDRLIQTEKLAALGRLVAGVAHEINTPVGTSLTVTSTLISKTDEFELGIASGQVRRSFVSDYIAASREATSQILNNLHQAADLTQSFKQVAADRNVSDRRSFDVGQVTDQVVKGLRSGLRNNSLTISVQNEPNLAVSSYPGPYGQVLTNLVLNAAMHAFPEGTRGSVLISARALGADDVEIVLSDDGSGMAPEIKRQAFDPFFTTRRGRGSTGLGLHIVHNIVTDRLGGEIDLESEPGRGTMFRIVLPREAPMAVE
jgi:PAS domain S-box-containing protein